MDITIGVKHVNREITLESNQSAEDVLAAVRTSTQEGTALVLEDEKGRQVIVPADSLGYVEIGSTGQRRVGFGLV